jgi:hypothetical protein
VALADEPREAVDSARSHPTVHHFERNRPTALRTGQVREHSWRRDGAALFDQD